MNRSHLFAEGGVAKTAMWLSLFFAAATSHRPANAQTTGLAPTLSGDCNVSGTGVITCTKANGTSFAPSATVDVTQASNITSGTVATERLLLEPKYFYAGKHFAQFSARQAVSSPSQLSPTLAPTHVVMFADSKSGYYLSDLLLRLNNVQPLNGLGAISFYSLFQSDYGSLATFSNTGAACTQTRNDVASQYSFGPSGSYLECPTGAVITYAPTTLLPYDVLAVSTRTTSAGGTYSIAVNGTTLQSVSTAGTEALGYTLVNTGINHNAANVTTLTVTSGTVRFYTIGSWQKAQSGLVVHLLNSGGSLLQQWATQPAYAAQYLAAVNPAEIKIEMGTNDAGAGVSAPTNAANLNAFLSGLNLSSLAVPPDVEWITEWDRGSVSGSTCVADTAGNALLDGYRGNVFSAQATWGYGILDLRAALPSFSQAFANGFYVSVPAIDCIHPSAAGQSLVAQKIAAGEQVNTDLGNDMVAPSLRKQSTMYMPRSGAAVGLAVAQLQSSGGVADSGTGLYANGDFFHLENRLLGTLYDRFGQLGGSYNYNMNPGTVNAFPYTLGSVMHTLYPDATYPCPLYAYRMGSAVNEAWSLCANATDNNWDWDFWNTGLIISNQGKPWLNMTNLNQLSFSSDASVSWTGSSSAITTAGGGSRGMIDVGLSRSSAGVVSVDTAVRGNSAGSLSVAGFQPNIMSAVMNTTLTIGNYTVLCNAASGAVTMTLPATVTRNMYVVKKVDSSSNTCTVNGGGHNIDGSTSTTLSTQYSSLRLQGDNTQWWLL